jgi:hypothetical protein
VSQHWKKGQFSDNEKKLRDLLIAEPMSFKDLRQFFNSPTTLTKHLTSLEQKGIIRHKKHERLYEIIECEREHVRAEQISDHIGDFLSTLDENTLSYEIKSKEKPFFAYVLIDYPPDYFDREENKPRSKLTVAEVRERPLMEVKECAISASKIEVDAEGNESVRLSFPRIEKGKKIMYFICREG